MVLQMPFFPFINMCGIFLCLGIGADDVFVVIQTFDDCVRERAKTAKADGQPPPTGIDGPLLAAVMRESVMATLVTSCTTSAAFFASASSTVTAIRAFGVFCGLVVMADVRHQATCDERTTASSTLVDMRGTVALPLVA